MDKEYDVGVVGCWYWGNYGSILNGYATYHLLSSMGLKVLNIVTPNNGFEPHAKKFFKVAYPEDAISEVLPFERVKEYNQYCKIFLSGSDQIWNNASTLQYNEFFRLAFVDGDKRKISFSTSFGGSIAPPDLVTGRIYANLLQKYNYISVREDTGVDICRKYYGVKATQVMEPVLDVKADVWNRLADFSDFPTETEPYLLAYILDPTTEKADAIKFYAKKLGVKFINILDGFSGRYDANKAKLNLENTLPNITAYDFLKYFSNASFIISDSFHGTAFSLVFNKPFISITNKQRGVSRFQTLLGKVGLMDRLVDDKSIPKDERFLYHIDFVKVNNIIDAERTRAVEWLKNAVFCIENVTAKLPQNIVDRLNSELCMGCGACVSTCPTGALSLDQDKYGYYRSFIDREKCINCGLCISKCAALSSPHNLNAKTPLSYAFVCKDKTMLMNSASGGAFPVLAKEAINRNGVVVGASWTENFVVKHIFVDKYEDIIKLQKSKYLQSYLGSCFKEIKAKLDQGTFVLFTGCPCQVAGLKKYLGKNYSNLLLIDLFCAGCPSQLIFDKYIASKFIKKDIEEYQFRVKTGQEKVWDAYTYSVKYVNGNTLVERSSEQDYYNQLLLLAGSHCRKCKYEGTTRFGDLTIGDCWGIQNYDDSIDPSNGVSAILVNNEKGENFLNSISNLDIEVLKTEPLEQIKKYNVCAFQENRNWPSNHSREVFYSEILRGNFMDAMGRALKTKKD